MSGLMDCGRPSSFTQSAVSLLLHKCRIPTVTCCSPVRSMRSSHSQEKEETGTYIQTRGGLCMNWSKSNTEYMFARISTNPGLPSYVLMPTHPALGRLMDQLVGETEGAQGEGKKGRDARWRRDGHGVDMHAIW